MIDISNKEDCCGCNACGDICAHSAISFKTDHEGFWYPEVDKDKCVGCGACVDTCPMGCISIGDDGKAEIDASICISCGSCRAVCPVEAPDEE